MSYEYIIDNVGKPAVLEQLAEECAELAHAALKLARILRAENPTPVTLEDALTCFYGEVHDVCCCVDVAREAAGPYELPPMVQSGTERWRERIADRLRQQLGEAEMK